MKILYLILARKNSKRLKNKNLSKINNQTLVQLTIKFAKKLTSSKNIVVSTDSKKINLILKVNSKNRQKFSILK